MKVFISWSGETSRLVADALRSWLPDVMQSISPFMSDIDIAAGEGWDKRVADELEDAAVGIICLTPENLASPAILYEVGALSQKLGVSFVCPYLFGVFESALKWPLGRLQAKRADRAGSRAILDTINRKLGDDKLEADRLNRAFKQWWPALQKTLAAIQKTDESVRWFDSVCLCANGPIALIASAVPVESDELQSHFEYSTGSGQYYALSELLPMISKTYPNQQRRICFASHIEQAELDQYNLVLLGGSPTNRHTKTIMESIQSSYIPTFGYRGQEIFDFPDQNKNKRFGPLFAKPELAKSVNRRTVAHSKKNATSVKDHIRPGALVQDYGLIVRAWNPFDDEKRRRVICLIGTTTFGTEAAAKLLCTPENESQLGKFPCSLSLVSTSVDSRSSRSIEPEIVSTVELRPK